jgi:2-isopropylmalate synthase
MKSVRLYDTTLRDGTQMREISLSVLDKLKIAEKLDRAGMPLFSVANVADGARGER